MLRLQGCCARLARVCVLITLLLMLQPGLAEQTSEADHSARLRAGEVVVTCTAGGGARFVTGRIHIDQPPERVWPILVNPFEFEGKICPRMKEVVVMVDRPELSVLKCSVDICAILPRISYVVESRYQTGKVEFRRISGLPREFHGHWQVSPLAGGARSEVTYALFVDPGIPVPQWIVREGVRVELPKTLVALRERIMNVYAASVTPEARTIVAAAGTDMHMQHH